MSSLFLSCFAFFRFPVSEATLERVNTVFIHKLLYPKPPLVYTRPWYLQTQALPKQFVVVSGVYTPPPPRPSVPNSLMSVAKRSIRPVVSEHGLIYVSVL